MQPKIAKKIIKKAVELPERDEKEVARVIEEAEC